MKHSCEIRERIKRKAKLVDNYGMKSLIIKKGSGRYKKKRWFWYSWNNRWFERRTKKEKL
ncbi:hypothetical protein [Spiroplasma turonicum]|uniref:hypothetical protein n=1 Tax=Spiroplasma turonicum TaxID=216946 RepID=UPI00130DA13C|nr:hypothetical protein [Spiroplasma turonicum]